MISGATRTYALLGHPVRHSPSPAIHNAWFAAHRIDGVYVALEIPPKHGRNLVAAVRTLRLAGANLTVPYKEAVLEDIDRLEPAAQAAGAVNTLWWDNRTLVGANTDGEGLLLSLAESGIDVAGRRVVIVGTGGAGRGVGAAMLSAGVERLTLLNRTVPRARAAAEAWRDHGIPIEVGPLEDLAACAPELVVVCTSAPVLLRPAPAVRDAVWCDLSYKRPEPASSTVARTAGFRVLDGTGMLRWQAALAFERWTGVRPVSQES